MISLNSKETNSIQDAVNYYDCAAEKTLIDKVDQIKDKDVVILTKDEVAKLMRHIEELNETIFYGEPAPQVLSFFSTLRKFTQYEEITCWNCGKSEVRMPYEPCANCQCV